MSTQSAPIEDLEVPAGEGHASSLVQQLLMVTKVIRGTFDRRLSDANASLPTWAILDALSGNEQISQRRLGDLCNIEGPTLTRYLDRLTIQGLICRERDRRDRRVVRVSFTDAGRAYYAAVRSVATEVEATIESLLSFEEQDALIALLDQMASRLGRP
jgi:MarR family transcriptional regulator for hemolysin